MKRLLIALIIIITVLTGCGGAAKTTDIVPANAAETILSGVTFRDDLVKAEGDVARDYYNLDDKVGDFAIYISGSGATAEEIAVIKSSDVKTAQATLEKRVDDLKFRFEKYNSEEMAKLKNPVIVAKGDVVVMVLADDSAQAKKTVDSLFK